MCTVYLYGWATEMSSFRWDSNNHIEMNESHFPSSQRDNFLLFFFHMYIHYSSIIQTNQLMTKYYSRHKLQCKHQFNKRMFNALLWQITNAKHRMLTRYINRIWIVFVFPIIIDRQTNSLDFFSLNFNAQFSNVNFFFLLKYSLRLKITNSLYLCTFSFSTKCMKF